MPAVSEELSSIQHLLLFQRSRASRTPSFFADEEIEKGNDSQTLPGLVGKEDVR